MKKIFATLLLSIFLFHPLKSQTLKLSIYGGGGGSNTPYNYTNLQEDLFIGKITGEYSIQGFYMWGSNISYPFYKNELGIFIETNNRFSNVGPISYRSNILAAGLIWHKPISIIRIELLGGIGYSWDIYGIEKFQNVKYRFSNNLSVIHGGFNVDFPIYKIVNLTIGSRFTFNNKSHIFASAFFINKNKVKVPSVLYTGMLGISMNIFDWK